MNGALAAGVGIGAVLLALPVARLTVTLPDRDNARWWAGARASAARGAATGVVGVLFLELAAAAAGWSAALPAWLALALLLTPLAIVDIEHHRLPNRLVLPGYALGPILLGVAAGIDGAGPAFVRALICGASAYAVFALLAAMDALGYGDVKLIGLLAGYLGWLGWNQVLLGIFAGFVIGAVIALALIVSRRARWRSELAFGPPLMLGALVVAAAT